MDAGLVTLGEYRHGDDGPAAALTELSGMGEQCDWLFLRGVLNHFCTSLLVWLNLLDRSPSSLAVHGFTNCGRSCSGIKLQHHIMCVLLRHMRKWGIFGLRSQGKGC